MPQIRVADPLFNAERIIEKMHEADEKQVKVLAFPELCLTGATCGDLFFQKMLLEGALEGLRRITAASRGMDMLAIVGLPIDVGGRVYSVAAVINDGEVLAFIPRTNVDGTHFTPPETEMMEILIPELGAIYFNADILFTSKVQKELLVAIQLGSDRNMPMSPAVRHTGAGATLIVELDSFPMSTYSARIKKNALITDSNHLHCGWISAAPGEGESTTDKVYSGLCVIAENGEIVDTMEQGSGLLVTELDMEYIVNARRRTSCFKSVEPHACIPWGDVLEDTVLTRTYSKTPFLPDDPREIPEFCERALEIQVNGIIKRMQYTGYYKPVIGVSGGVDSTLVMLACARAMDKLGLPRKNIIAITMPCFGTTDRTKNNAITIAEQLGATLRVIPIGDSVMEHFKAIGHDYESKNVVFENAQARERTMVLLDVANEEGGLNVGTKDLSEQADGWCTFNGDQISNYDINAGLTKTMVRMVVKYVADNCDDPILRDALYDIGDTPVTPELLPPSRNGELIQKSEDSVGPYELQDFFLWHMVIRGASPEKVLRVAENAYGEEYDRETLIKWLRSYCTRFFSQQFKRNCSADGPAVMGFTLSPRDGYKMPSDVCNALWINAVNEL